ncbi:hypothetical protein GCM10027035_10850 [Emticicia sediminis]
MSEFISTITEIIYSRGNENSFYYTFSTLAQVLSGIYAVIGTITLFRLENLFKVRDENIINVRNISLNVINQPFLGQHDIISINQELTFGNIEKIVNERVAYWKSKNITPIESFDVVEINLSIIKGIFQQIDFLQAILRKFTLITIFTIIWCIISLSLAKFIIDSKCWFTVHVIITLILTYCFLKFFRKQYYITFGIKLSYLP